MKKLLVATVAGLVAATVALPARADGPGYSGTCRLTTLNDTLPGSFGGQDSWTAQVVIAVVATTPGDAMVSAGCWLRVNGGSESKVLDATVAGVVGAGAGRTTFNAAVDDIVELCTHVTTTLAGASDVCVALTTTPVCPDQVCGEGGLVDQAVALLDTTDPVFYALDPAICARLVALSETVDTVPAFGLVHVDPATGDTYVGGTTPEYLFWDCPPYVES